jgi:hypothetical protein
VMEAKDTAAYSEAALVAVGTKEEIVQANVPLVAVKLVMPTTGLPRMRRFVNMVQFPSRAS